MNHVTTWAILVIIVLLSLKMLEGYIVSPSNVQDTITGDKKYIYM